MEKLRSRLGSLRPPSKASASGLSAATLAALATAPETQASSSTIVLPDPGPRRCPPDASSRTMTSLRGAPSAAGAAALPAAAQAHRNTKPLYADFDTAHFVVGGGVAIFHLATSCVVLCWHTRDRYWFLPKGRRDVGEESGTGAEREGFEESGYRNRLLPLPIDHRQPSAAAVTAPLSPLTASPASSTSPKTVTAQFPSSSGRAPPRRPSHPHGPAPSSIYNTEPLLTQLLPVTRSRQYLLHWFVAETLPPGAEARVNDAARQAARQRGVNEREVYVPAPAWPEGLTLRARVEQDWKGSRKGGQDRGETNGHSGTAESGPSIPQKARVTSSGSWRQRQEPSRYQPEPPPSPPSPPHVHASLPGPYEPQHHLNTGVDSEEMLYDSALVPVEEAVRRLQGSGMEYVVRKGWELICRRWAEEEADESAEIIHEM